MLFNSYQFIFLFLPIALGGFFLLSKLAIRPLVTAWLVAISVFFYACWDAELLLLLLMSITVNWLISGAIAKQRTNPSTNQKLIAKSLLILGLCFNLGLLGYFKYSNFFIETISQTGIPLNQISDLVLPLGISFYTFEQISYLVNVANGGRHYGLMHFLLFVTFFPHLIAGPILSAKELIPQFRSLNYCFNVRNVTLGLTVFAVGLFKKTVLADSVTIYATPIFQSADQGHSISFFLAWQAAIAYTLQLYFDFSGYSDMAIGLAKMFNIKLPINFFSPYKSVSVGDFWRRWHISLSRFLRDYLYIPLGGSRYGQIRRYFNLFITMLLGGLWHGANWTFIFWGCLHGIYLCIDHFWQQLIKRYNWKFTSSKISLVAAQSLTFLAVVVSWVLFRSETVAGAGRILRGMAGLEGFILPESFASKLSAFSRFGVEFGVLNNYGDAETIALLLALLAIVFFSPNIYEFMQNEPVALDVYGHLKNRPSRRWLWQPTGFYAVVGAMILAIAIGFCNRPSEFLYFQF